MFPDGTLQTTAALGSHVPQGAILLWSGSHTTVPSGWTLCNGQAGTPDLRDRFVVGSGGNYPDGQTGGSTTHSHLVGGTGSLTVDDNSGGTDYHEVSANHLPPYYALAYIMKL